MPGAEAGPGRSTGDVFAAAGAAFGTSGLRGPAEAFSPALCEAAIAAFLGLAGTGARRLLIGADLRPSSPAIAAACHRAAERAGWSTVHAGAVPTPALALAAGALGCPAVMVTGSHIPASRNGLKFFLPAGEIGKAEEQAMRAAPAPMAQPGPPPGAPPGAFPAIASGYVARYLDGFPAGALSGMRIGVYEHSSAARDLLHTILRGLGAETLGLGRSEGFVALDTEALEEADIARAAAWASAHRLDALVSADGDADRPLLADEAGRWLRGDVLGIVCAIAAGARAVVTPLSSTTAAEACGRFGTVIRTPVGAPHVIAAMAGCTPGQHPVIGYEANGGLILGSTLRLGGQALSPLLTRDAVLPLLLALWSARRAGLPVSALAAGLPERHTASGRLKEVDSMASARLLTALGGDEGLLAALLAPGSGPVRAVSRLDGLRAVFATGEIVHVRASGNAPELRCYAEAGTQARAGALCSGCLGRMKEWLGG